MDKKEQKELLNQQKFKYGRIVRQVIIDLSQYINILDHTSIHSILSHFSTHLKHFYNYKRKGLNESNATSYLFQLFKDSQYDLIQYDPFIKVNHNGYASINITKNHHFEITITVKNEKE
eukprot:58064_1